MGTFYLAFLLAPTILREGSILRVGEVQYEANQRFAEKQRMKNNLRGSKNKIEHSSSRALLEDLARESGGRFLDVNTSLGGMNQLPESVLKKSRVLQQQREGQREREQEQEGVPKAAPPAPSRGMYGRFSATYAWIKRELRSHQESEFSLSLIFILSGAICFAVGILLTLHTYLGEPQLKHLLEQKRTVPERTISSHLCLMHISH